VAACCWGLWPLLQRYIHTGFVVPTLLIVLLLLLLTLQLTCSPRLLLQVARRTSPQRSSTHTSQQTRCGLITHPYPIFGGSLTPCKTFLTRMMACLGPYTVAGPVIVLCVRPPIAAHTCMVRHLLGPHHCHSLHMHQQPLPV
jgi:hypothetical protein